MKDTTSTDVFDAAGHSDSNRRSIRIRTLAHARSAISSIISLPAGMWSEIEDWLTVRIFAAGAQIIGIGDVERRALFVSRGLVRQYFRDGERHINKEFWLEGEFVSSYRSFLTDEPSRYAIEAVEETICVEFGRDLIRELYAQHPVFERLGRRIAEQKYLAKDEREEMLLLADALQRYEHILSRRPVLIRRLPLYHLASYLRLAPETLSRVRRSLTPAGS